MNSSQIKIIVVGLLLIIISLVGQAEDQKNSKMISIKMQEMQKNLSSLLLLSSSNQQFNDPANKKQIEKELKSFTKTTHNLDQNVMFMDADPVVKFLPNQLSADTTEAYLAFREGNTAYARNMLRSTSSYCISCHSRSSAELQFSKTFFQAPSSLKSFELDQFYAVSRQFDAAIEYYLKAIQENSIDRADLEEAINQSMAIAVRVKSKPTLAMEIAQTVIQTKTIPMYLKMNALDWKKSISEWETKKTNPPEDEKSYYTQAKNLLDQALKIKKYPMDRSADILYLRASGLLHELIRKAPHGKYFSEALFLEGICYEVLSPRKVESMSNIYFEACIRSAPHTDTSESCYRRYEENIYSIYSGNSGVQIPEEIKNKLIELWTISILTKRLDEARK